MYLVDIQGTLIDDKKREPIDGAIEFIDSLNKNEIPYVLITNNMIVNRGPYDSQTLLSLILVNSYMLMPKDPDIIDDVDKSNGTITMTDYTVFESEDGICFYDKEDNHARTD